MRFGQLPNGLRYALKYAGIAASGVSFRLRIGSGSLQERDGEQGLAHFLEHMAFRGSAGLPDGEMIHRLQRQGLAFGPDTNAFTSLEQTVYHFDFPQGGAAAAESGLSLLREIADRLTLDPQLIEQERGVILSEERASDQPLLRMQMAETRMSMAGTLAPQRWPIGKVDTIKAVSAEKLRRFYRENYRPDNAMLVIVGYFDVDAAERQIRDRFGDWAAVSPGAAPAPAATQSLQKTLEFAADGVPDVIALTWRQPPDLRMPTLEVERERLVDQIGVAILNTRLSTRTLEPGSPFVFAMAAWQPRVLRLAGLAKVAATPAPNRWDQTVTKPWFTSAGCWPTACRTLTFNGCCRPCGQSFRIKSRSPTS